MSKRGGSRKGAGRPPKWTAEDVIRVGSACEDLMRLAQKNAVAARLSARPDIASISARHLEVNYIPVEQRAHWIESEAYEDHCGDIEAFLHRQAKTPFDDNEGNFSGPAPRTVSVPKKPPRGTRKNIIIEVAASSHLSPVQVANLWQEFRRLFPSDK